MEFSLLVKIKDVENSITWRNADSVLATRPRITELRGLFRLALAPPALGLTQRFGSREY